MRHVKFLSILAIIALIGCSPEENVLRNDAKKTVRIENITFQDLQRQTKAFEKLKNVNRVRLNESIGRVEYDEQFKVWYDTDKIVHITRENYQSFTIPIIKEESDEYLKNLVIYSKDAIHYYAKIINYKLSDVELIDLQDKKYVDIREKVYAQQQEEQQQEDIPNQTYNWSWTWVDISGCVMTMNIFVVPGQMCSQYEHNVGDPDNHECIAAVKATAPMTYIQVYSFCPPGDGLGGGSEPYNPPTNPDNGGGGGTNDGTTPIPIPTTPTTPEEEPEDEIITTPVVPGFDQEIPADPCKELKKMFERQPFKEKVQSYNTSGHFNALNEAGFGEARITALNGTVTPTYINGTPGGTDNLKYATNLKLVGKGHTHHNDAVDNFGLIRHSIKLPSATDISDYLVTTQRHASILGVSSRETYNLTITSEGTYCLKMLQNNLSYTNFTSVDWKQYKIDLKKNFEHLVNKGQNSQTNVEKMWLNLLKEYEIDDAVGLYKTTGNEFTNWNRLILNDSNSVISNPCP